MEVVMVFVAGGFGGVAATFLWALLLPDKKKCPGAMCNNILPRQGIWDPKNAEWLVEECPICLSSIRFVSAYHNPALTDSKDRYVRVAPRKDLP